MSFIPAHGPSLESSLDPLAADAPVARWLLIRDGRIALDGSGRPPEWSPSEAYGPRGVARDRAHYLGRWDGMDCWAAEMPGSAPSPGGLQAVTLREAIAAGDDEFFRIASQASQLLTWAATSRFCPSCGTPTERCPDERAMKCPSCGALWFPRLCPAVIVAVLKDEQILLARSRRFAPGMYSVLAGFVEAGETLEECVHREIREETGIEVSDLRYFGSQSWPFPNSLMLAFTARYHSGEMRIDDKELEDAGWYGRDNLPGLPLPASVARRMIEWYRAGASCQGR